MAAMSAELQAKLKTLPKQPGCYIFKDAQGAVLYVGKAVNLRQRVRSYFQKSAQHTPKVARMVRKIADLEWIVTDSELEALILEANLIKKHRPPYNVLMRDDKSYPYLCLTLSEKFPRLLVTRRVRQDGNRYFGPFANSGAVWSTHQLLHRTFPLIPCGKVWDGTPKQRPCLYYHMGRCLAPCAGLANPEAYRQIVRQVQLFLEGKGDDLIRQLTAQMEQAAENLEFERAAKLRDQIRALQEVLQRQKVVQPEGVNEDVIALVKDERGACVQMFFIRNGKLLGQRSFFLTEGAEDNPNAIMSEFLKQYYQDAPEVPDKILLPYEITEAQIIAQWLRQKRGSAVEIRVPHRGEDAQLLEMAARNAELALQSLRQELEHKQDWAESALLELQEVLNLPHLPQRIEAYDISNIQGIAPVGSMVVFEGGQPKKSDYRRFRIKWHPESPDDFAMMKEVITRRLREALEGDAKWRTLPDLILIDGGKGQLNAALEAMHALGFQIPAIGLAKRHEQIILPDADEPLELPHYSKALHLLQRIRDEAHRFAVSYHRKLREQRAVKSPLDEIPGIGPRRKKMLLRLFGSIDRIREASLDELASVPTMTRKLAQQVLDYLRET
ncbi:MAG: excinuclease ABC subunit UvrC [Fimbriimonadales bacterium]|nr:excinuclease ABC subunit UvrC [Fimbriimonadales bacterium]MDW8051999.1 excinuclease ABC subunit UvrC [Armatimonadota bacterium]